MGFLNAKRTPCTQAVPEVQNVKCVFGESIVMYVAASDKAVADQCLCKSIMNREKANIVFTQ